ncbi:MAG: trigger factor, partial [Clostridia bacterium]|nr:trigger factor [Clostridia bacterium]
DGVELSVPRQMVEKQLNYMVSDLNARLASQGLSKEAYFEFLGTTEDAFKKEREKDAERSVKTSLVLESIMENEKIEVTEAELDERVKALAEMYSQTAENIKKMLGNEGLTSVKQELLTNKVINFLKENNEIA